jgi:hypothetical protein
MKKVLTLPDVTRTSRWAMAEGANGSPTMTVDRTARNKDTTAVPAGPAIAGARHEGPATRPPGSTPGSFTGAPPPEIDVP